MFLVVPRITACLQHVLQTSTVGVPCLCFRPLTPFTWVSSQGTQVMETFDFFVINCLNLLRVFSFSAKSASPVLMQAALEQVQRKIYFISKIFCNDGFCLSLKGRFGQIFLMLVSPSHPHTSTDIKHLLGIGPPGLTFWFASCPLVTAQCVQMSPGVSRSYFE